MLLAWNMIKSCSKPNRTVWYLTVQLKQAKDIVWREILAILGPSRQHFKANESNLEIVWDNGSTIYVKGAKEPDCRRGPALDLLAIDEAQDFDGDDYMTIFRPLLSGRQGKAIIAGTKKLGSWFLAEWNAAARGEIPMSKAFQFPSTSNPAIPASEWDATKEYFKQRGRIDIWENEYICDPLAKIGRSVDLKFCEFDFLKHVVTSIPIPPLSRIFCGMDWGMTDKHPTVVVWGAWTPERLLYIFDELVLYGEDPDHAARKILDKNENLRPEGYVLDASCWSRETDGRNAAQRLSMSGLNRLFKASREDKKHGKAGTLKMWLNPVEGPPRIRIFSNCRFLINELQCLRWENTVGDDSTDALIYLVNFLNFASFVSPVEKEQEDRNSQFKPAIVKLDIPWKDSNRPRINPDTGYFT